MSSSTVPTYLAQGLAAVVHKGGGLEQTNRLALVRGGAILPLKGTAQLQIHSQPLGQLVDYEEPGVVPGHGVLFARVAQPYDEQILAPRQFGRLRLLFGHGRDASCHGGTRFLAKWNV